ncbi:unnamed protein product [Cuscuta epithymum]|uniref:VQ domain-containing protein n=1 Tax=Cuscuta epithymum TaxID=186058 RepID=A0AAV0FHG8_9ASTE|nr:unnamed protein product [Cuscuta epithymum]
MEKPSSVQQKKALKQTKTTTKSSKQLKVVYISNPMRVETSPSEFKDLVQELTGQDADVPDASKFPATTQSPGASGEKPAVVFPDGGGRVVTEEDLSGEGRPAPESSDLSSEAGQDYVPELIEAFPAGVMPSNMWYD